MRKLVICVGLVLGLAGATGAAWAAAPAALLDFVEVLQGPADVQTRGTWLFIGFPGQDGAKDRTFRIDTADLNGLVSFQTSSSRILYWGGNLILLDQKSERAWHFWVPAADERSKARPGVRPEAEGLAALLADYQVTRVVAHEISSHSWAKGLQPARPDGLVSLPLKYQPESQDPGGTGVGSCGTQCSISCADGSSCQASSCGPNRCASCTCPASCVCS